MWRWTSFTGRRGRPIGGLCLRGPGGSNFSGVHNELVGDQRVHFGEMTQVVVPNVEVLMQIFDRTQHMGVQFSSDTCEGSRHDRLLVGKLCCWTEQKTQKTQKGPSYLDGFGARMVLGFQSWRSGIGPRFGVQVFGNCGKLRGDWEFSCVLGRGRRRVVCVSCTIRVGARSSTGGRM